MAWFRKRTPKPTQPVRPVEVVLHLHDGTQIEVDCTYVGVVWEEGREMHNWQVVQMDTPPYNSIHHISVGMLPAHTRINF